MEDADVHKAIPFLVTVVGTAISVSARKLFVPIISTFHGRKTPWEETKMKSVTLTRRDSIESLSFPGAFCFAIGRQGKKLLLACPVCGIIMVCPHSILKEDPLTLGPSVVGPVFGA